MTPLAWVFVVEIDAAASADQSYFAAEARYLVFGSFVACLVEVDLAAVATVLAVIASGTPFAAATVVVIVDLGLATKSSCSVEFVVAVLEP